MTPKILLIENINELLNLIKDARFNKEELYFIKDMYQKILNSTESLIAKAEQNDEFSVREKLNTYTMNFLELLKTEKLDQDDIYYIKGMYSGILRTLDKGLENNKKFEENWKKTSDEIRKNLLGIL